jgi:hypothetical protein
VEKVKNIRTVVKNYVKKVKNVKHFTCNPQFFQLYSKKYTFFQIFVNKLQRFTLCHHQTGDGPLSGRQKNAVTNIIIHDASHLRLISQQADSFPSRGSYYYLILVTPDRGRTPVWCNYLI